MKKIITLFVLISAYLVSYGVYLENVPCKLTQPNGEVLHLFITGDEFFRRVHDSAGYSIVPDNDGWYYYALYDADNDELVPSMYLVSSTQTAPLHIAKGLGISHKKYMEIRRAYYEPTGCYPSGASKNSLSKRLANNYSKSTQQLNNIVICIGFADTEEMTHNFPTVDGMFNSDEGNNMRDYFKTMSYNNVDVVSHFYPPADGTILRFYKDIYPRSYFEIPGSDGWMEHSLLARAVNWVNANHPIPAHINLDIDNDGDCDFITFVVYGPVGEWAALLWPHKWSLYYENVSINGKRVWDYNFELDGTPNYFNTSVFCHEGYHVLGAPDLYHYDWAYRDMRAVGFWDVMDQGTRPKPQSMSAYMKYKYGNWIPTLPTATINKTYEVYPFYTNDGTNPNKPVIYRLPMNYTDEYSVVEYRKKAGMSYEDSLKNEGLMIYRINPQCWGNAQFGSWGDADEVYLYRPGSYPEGWIQYSNGELLEAPFNPSNGKTAFNSTTNPYPFGTYYYDDSHNINHILYDEVTDSYTFFYGAPANRNISINKTELLLDSLSGSTGTVTITSNVVWYITIPENALSWLTVSNAKGLNDGTVTFTTLSENIGNAPRTADVIISGNEQTFTVRVIQDFILGIYGNEQPDEINIYPNPASDILFIQGENISQIEIFDLQGRMLKSVIKPAGQVDISDLGQGVYFIKIEGAGRQKMVRFVKVRD